MRGGGKNIPILFLRWLILTSFFKIDQIADAKKSVVSSQSAVFSLQLFENLEKLSTMLQCGWQSTQSILCGMWLKVAVLL